MHSNSKGTWTSPFATTTGAAIILASLEAAGITHVFVNLGSDHPAFLSAFASHASPRLKLFTSPNEMNALSAASGYAQVTGKAAAVLVHVECGTQGLAGAVHNVSKGRIPVLILAGTVPVTMEGELRGSRNEYIHWIQDVPDQRAIVRQYMRYEHEIRSALNAPQIVYRALQISLSSPQGPSYLVVARETLEQQLPQHAFFDKPSQNYALNQPLELNGLTPAALEELSNVLLNAETPLVVTSYCGLSEAGFHALQALAEVLAIAVQENAPICNSFDTTSFLHQGHQWNGGGQLPALAEADVVVVLDSDVPWIPTQSKPRDDAPCPASGDGGATRRSQLLDTITSHASFSSAPTRSRIQAREERLRTRFAARQARLTHLESITHSASGRTTVPYFMATLRRTFATCKRRVVALNESTTNLGNVADHLGHTTAKSLIGSGGGALGWYSGGAVGVGLALQEAGRSDDSLVVAFTGDGTWLFGVPSCAYWMAAKYGTPFLTVIWNNGGWASPKNACLRIHPEILDPRRQGTTGKAGTLSEEMLVAIDPSPHFGKIAEGAGSAWWTVVEGQGDVEMACKEAVRVVLEEKRCAVVEVLVEKI